ncbi:probable E3 ubiquitin-protein ligase bre1 isoform X2 [Xenia sp. Carnegie-2017]|uniref:probable E3 ubiquitin-protein ligase bre1 isoform X2 n=1 Tax=Xenia sp. Carnegie-2017 TaxID=2897299 RepID=UPI001F033DFD|nr:probable E3 ubiquitin-protein ligase bre1 isoform X2 [Xenia sp. Carnegie-2017]
MARNSDPDVLKGKLSKKIAELSTIVQALFTKNHEKELELTATKQTYDNEIKRVTEEGKHKLNWLEKQLDDLERFRTLLEMKTAECEQRKETIESLHKMQVESERKVVERGKMLTEAFAEIETLKSEIAARSPEEIQKMKQANLELSEKLLNEQEHLKEEKDNANELKNKLKTIEESLSDMLAENRTLKEECCQLKEELSFAQDEVRLLRNSLHEAKRHGGRALQRTQKLEEKTRQMAAENLALERTKQNLNEQMNKIISTSQLKGKSKITLNEVKSPGKMKKVDITTLSLDGLSKKPVRDEEVRYLKKEIEKYRLELKNREANFNRVFADKTPLIIKKPIQITADEMRLRNFTGLSSFKNTYATLPSVVGVDSKAATSSLHSTNRKKL